MTTMSRRGAPGVGQRPRNAVLARWIGVWHAACFPLLSGCFYLVPWEYAPENLPPEVVSMSPENDSPVILDSNVALIVYVQDYEADVVTFTWTLSGEGYMGEASPIPTGGEDRGFYGHQLPLADDPDYDGQSAFCDVWDGESEHVTIRWDLEVAE